MIIASASDSEHELIWFRRPRGRRGPEPTLSREQITAAAIELADTEGLEAVSIRKIAAKLGAGATSLYWHIASKDDLYELMVDEVVGSIRLEEPSGDWRADLREIAITTHATLRSHPWIALVGIQPGLGPKTRQFGAIALRVFDPLELDLATRIQALAAINNYIFGFLHRETAWERTRARSGLDEAQWDQRLRAFLGQAGDRDDELAEHMGERFELTDPQSFNFGLECLLDGFATRLPPVGS